MPSESLEHDRTKAEVFPTKEGHFAEFFDLGANWDHKFITKEGDTYYSTRLVGGDSTQEYGLAKSLSVMPGDTIEMEVMRSISRS